MRDDLESWLRAPYQVWHWREDDQNPDRYQAVETTTAGFRWFAWSHLHGEDGLSRDALQSYDDFRRDGPLRSIPGGLEGQLTDWLVTQTSST